MVVRLAIVGSLTLFAMLALRGALAFADPHPNNGPTTVVGTRHDDVLAGGHGPDRLYGKGGNDRIWMGRGPDQAYCGGGFDRVHNHWSTGNDYIAPSCEKVVT